MSQNNQILQYLKTGKTITAMTALNLFGCFRLAARVRDLKDSGYEIKSRIVKVDNKKFAEYWL